MTKDMTPEERLLKLIRGGHRSEKPPASGSSTPSAPAHEPSPEPVLRSKAQEVFIPKKKSINPVKIAAIFLIIFLIIGTGYFIYQISSKKDESYIIDIERLISAELEPERATGAKDKVPLIVEEEEEEPVEFRELFGAPVVKEIEPVAEEGPSISELAADLILVGVITGTDPQAIITNKRTRQTFYVSEGEDILEFKVQKVDQAIVILEYKEKTIKLSL